MITADEGIHTALGGVFSACKRVAGRLASSCARLGGDITSRADAVHQSAIGDIVTKEKVEQNLNLSVRQNDLSYSRVASKRIPTGCRRSS